MLANKTVVLGITGGIAAYKAADLASKLTQAGAKVETILTKSGQEFITAVTLRALTGRPVVTGMFDLASPFSIEHVALAEAADIVVIAPATANTIAKIASGIADDMLSCTVLATRAPVIVAPAMHNNMWENPVTQENIGKLKARGFTIVGPGYGRLASGSIGWGRLIENEVILGTISQVLGRKGDLAGKTIVVTAGGTQEPIDPVRLITNRSSGKQGYAVAEAARDRGAHVKLITTPVAISAPVGMDIIHVETALQMKEAVTRATASADALIMSAAVADYMPRTSATQKIKKEKSDSLTLELVKTPDIISEVSGNFLKIGFAAESEDLLDNARGKLIRKKLDLIVANDITRSDSGFGTDTNKVYILGPGDRMDDLPLMTKRDVGDKILDRVVEMLKEKGKQAETVQPPSSATSPKSVEITLPPSALTQYYIPVRASNKQLFPDSNTIVILETGQKAIEVQFHNKPWGRWLGKGIMGWFKEHSELKEGDKVGITVIEPMERYRLEIL